MRDILPPETGRWQAVESAAREVFALYGYRELRLPLLERTELFARSIGHTLRPLAAFSTIPCRAASGICWFATSPNDPGPRCFS
jgi:hypothetical protein